MEILVYDGSFTGYLTLLNYLIKKKDLQSVKVVNKGIDREAEGLLLYRAIAPEEEEARGLISTVRSLCGEDVAKKLYIYYLCDTAKLEKPLARVLKRVFAGETSFENLTDEDVIRLYHAEREFFRERHRFYGLLRFIQVPEGPLVAVFEPKFNVLPKLYQHFVRRFPREDFLIIDGKRKLLFSYIGGKGALLWVDDLDIKLDPDVDPIIRLWQRYFKEIAVEERVSYERQRSRLPLRVRKFLPEFWEED